MFLFATKIVALEPPTIVYSDTIFYNQTWITFDVPSSVVVYYTTDGSTPTDSTGNLWASGMNLKINESCTLKAIAKCHFVPRGGCVVSDEVYQNFHKKATSPNFNGFTFSSDTALITIDLMRTKNNRQIYYTTDNTEPSTSSLKFNGLIVITNTTTIKAFATEDNCLNSDVIEELFVKQ